jgi:diacylglycerol kinase family enzyme
MPGGVLFLNPRAGSFSDADEAELRERARAAGLEIIDVHPSVDVAAITREHLRQGEKSFVVAGGDGSIHHVAQALIASEGVLGIVPTGTVNHTARDLDLPLEWRQAMTVAVSGRVRQIDTGRVNGIHFLNSVMVGIYPTITEYRERFRSTHSKWRAYLRGMRLAMRQFPHVNLVVELPDRVETLRTQLFVVSINAYDLTEGGLAAPKVSLDDGRLTIYSFGFMSRMQFIAAAAKFFRGKLEEVEGFRRIRTATLRIDSARPLLRVSIDGEVRDLVPPLQIQAAPASLLVRTP